MNDFFAMLYEHDGVFHDIFSTILWESSVYSRLGLSLLTGTVLPLLIFYFFITYPKCRWGHWFIAYILGISIVGYLTFYFLNTELVSYVYNDEEGVNSFIMNITFLNAGYSAILGLLLSIIPQFIIPNRPQSHLPFLIKSN